MYFGHFWGRFFSIFEEKSIIFLIKFGISCLTSLKRPRDGLKIAQDGFLEATLDQLEPKLAPSCLEMDSIWPQVASSWAQVGSKLAQVAGRQLEPRGAPGGPRGAKMAPRAIKMTQN